MKRIAWIPAALLVLSAAALLPGCGDDPSPRKEIELAPPQVEPVSPAACVAYALERLERGPRPLGGLRVTFIHRRNLELAEDDLIALESEAQRQLADPVRIERITTMARRNADPWHNVLRVLLGMETRPIELVLAWTRPVLDAPDALLTLRLEAARLLSAVPDARAAPLLLELFRRQPETRELSAVAFSALMHHGGETRLQALEIALREGSPDLWADAWQRLAGVVPAGEADREVADMMAWWCGMIVGSGPRMPVKLPHVKSYPWVQARLAADASSPRAADGRRSSLIYGPVSSSVAYGSGWYATDLSTQLVQPQYALVFTGKLPAAEGRCVLGRWGFAPYIAAVNADLAQRDDDEGLYYAAKHCMIATTTLDDEAVKAELEIELGSALPWNADRVRRVQRLMGSFSTCDDAQIWTLLERALFDMHPLDVCRPAIEQAYDAMRSRLHDLVPLVVARFEGQDAQQAGVAMHLIRRAREPIYLEALERKLDAAGAEEAASLRRTLTFIYSRGYGIEPERFAAFVKRYESWLAAASEREFVGLATGLLDFEAAGESAFVRGLRGKKRELYLAAWPQDRRIVAPEIAAAAARPMGADTDPAAVLRLLGQAYHSFPAESVGELKALQRRLLPQLQPLVEPVMERVSHRAPFRRNVK